jgi:hypothetical protein
MGITYEKAGPAHDATVLVAKVIDKHRPDLAAAGVTVTCLLAYAGKDKAGNPKPAVKHHGREAWAVVKRTSLKDRVAGQSDAIITIDDPKWETLNDIQREALIHHEIEHLQLKLDPTEAVEAQIADLDDHNRPKLTMKPHDWEVTGFRATVEKYGVQALDWKQTVDFMQGEDGQFLMGFAGEGGAKEQPTPRATTAALTAALSGTEKKKTRRKGGGGLKDQIAEVLTDAGLKQRANGEWSREPDPGDEIHTPDQLGLTAEEITRHAHEHLLTAIQQGKTPDVRTLPVTFDGDPEPFRYLSIGTAYVPAIPGVVKLLKLFTVAEWEEGGLEVYSTPEDAYCGARVRCMGEVYRIGPRGDALLVRVG